MYISTEPRGQYYISPACKRVIYIPIGIAPRARPRGEVDMDYIHLRALVGCTGPLVDISITISLVETFKLATTFTKLLAWIFCEWVLRISLTHKSTYCCSIIPNHSTQRRVKMLPWKVMGKNCFGHVTSQWNKYFVQYGWVGVEIRVGVRIGIRDKSHRQGWGNGFEKKNFLLGHNIVKPISRNKIWASDLINIKF